MIIKGKAWKFGNGISTDEIAPGRYFHLRANLPKLAEHVLEDLSPKFAKEVKKGDFLVGGENFGLGSSREHAAHVIKILGVGAVLAKSFARIFYRNAINIGLPVMQVDTDKIDDGDELEVDVSKGVVMNKTKGIKLFSKPLPKVMVKLLEEGGLIPYIKKHGDINVDRSPR
jgi:3-isopropylmalate/(R)-2-methylmalate dehydratase small subunit